MIITNELNLPQAFVQMAQRLSLIHILKNPGTTLRSAEKWGILSRDVYKRQVFSLLASLLIILPMSL